MLPVNPLLTAPAEQFVVGESDFVFFNNFACRCESGAILFCRSGRAVATVNQHQATVERDTILFLLPGSILMLTDRTDDFRMIFCAFSRDLFAEAGFRLEPAFFQAMRERPVIYLPARVIEGVEIWFQMASYTYRDRRNMFRNTIIRNRLQNVLYEYYDKLQRFGSEQHGSAEWTTRQKELFHRFAGLVNEYCRREREVAFYADRLCISTRYLSTIVHNISHTSVKEFIDRAVVLEIKMLLQTTDLSVQEIAYRLHFPDQSYLGRYFKKHTGDSPTAYRNTRK